MITTGDESVRGGQGGSENSGLSYSSGGSTGGIFPAGANPTRGKQGSRDATGGEQGGSAGAKRGSRASSVPRRDAPTRGTRELPLTVGLRPGLVPRPDLAPRPGQPPPLVDCIPLLHSAFFAPASPFLSPLGRSTRVAQNKGCTTKLGLKNFEASKNLHLTFNGTLSDPSSFDAQRDPV